MKTLTVSRTPARKYYISTLTDDGEICPDFVLKLQYKAEWFGKTILKINQWLPSSKTCNFCGYKHPNLIENIREWQCPECGTNHDRDINAAINIKNFALAPLERREGPVDSWSIDWNMKQEASPSRT